MRHNMVRSEGWIGYSSARQCSAIFWNTVLWVYRKTCEVLIPTTDHGVCSTQLPVQLDRSYYHKPSVTSLACVFGALGCQIRDLR
jgi:hypothetical protein